MSDTRTQAIHKAATELVQELLNAGKTDGGERWFHIIVRKMEGLPDRVPPKAPNAKLPLVIGGAKLTLTSLGLTVARAFRDRNAGGNLMAEEEKEIAFITGKDLTKLKLWLNGE